VTGGDVRLKGSWGHKGHSGVQTRRPSLCNMHNTVEHQFFMLAVVVVVVVDLYSASRRASNEAYKPQI